MDATQSAAHVEVALEAKESSSPSRLWEAENWARLQELFHLLERSPAGERASLLDESGSDPAMRERVLALLASVEEDAENGAGEVALGKDPEASPQGAGPEPAVAPAAYRGTIAPGTRVGPYALLRHLGSGGLGAVYLCERIVGGAVQQCALKVLSMHAAGASFESRFQREQQILATLNHPNITRLFDAGLSDTGQPYLVMEYVDGLELGEFCDRNRLSVRARTELFLNICEAVAYAHRNLVVHLDLKPSNILVTADGTVKLLDFGTSKLIDPEGALTTTVMATPAYAAPEQLRGEPVTTACDVYSLGAVLYELLSGQRPFQSPSVVMAMERAVKEQEPPRITTAVTKAGADARGVPAERLRQLLDGDLTSIVARCLRSRPRDRYASVDALADDLKRHMDGRPVLARKQTVSYRMAKFVRRHALAVAATAAVLLLLVAAGAFAYVRQQQALREGERAERMQNFMYRLIRLANTNYTGKPAATVPEFLQLGVKVLPDFIRNPPDQRAAQLSMAESMFGNQDFAHAQPVFVEVARTAHDAKDLPAEAEANAFGGMTASEIGQTELANQMTAEALKLSHAPGVTASQRVWIDGFYVSNRFNNGVRPESDVALLKQSIEESNGSGVTDRERGWARANLAIIDEQSGKIDEAEQLTQEALTFAKREPYTMCDQADLTSQLGDLRGYRGDDKGSIPLYQSAYDGLAKCEGPQDLNVLHVQALLGFAMYKAGDVKGSIGLLEPALPVWRKVAPTSVQFASPLIYQAQAYIADGRFEDALAVLAEAQGVLRGRMNPVSSAVAGAEVFTAQALAGEHRDAEALAAAEQAEATYSKMAKVSPVSRIYRQKNATLIQRLQTR